MACLQAVSDATEEQQSQSSWKFHENRWPRKDINDAVEGKFAEWVQHLLDSREPKRERGMITNSHWGLHYNGCLRNHIAVKASLPRGCSDVTPQSPFKRQPATKQYRGCVTSRAQATLVSLVTEVKQTRKYTVCLLHWGDGKTGDLSQTRSLFCFCFCLVKWVL